MWGGVSLSACVCVGKNGTEHHHPTRAVFGLNSGKIREDQSVKAHTTQDFKMNLRGDSFFLLVSEEHTVRLQPFFHRIKEKY